MRTVTTLLAGPVILVVLGPLGCGGVPAYPQPAEEDVSAAEPLFVAEAPVEGEACRPQQRRPCWRWEPSVDVGQPPACVARVQLCRDDGTGWSACGPAENGGVINAMGSVLPEVAASAPTCSDLDEPVVR